jgi:hypothetical protein
MMPEFTIKMDEHDFDMLSETSMHWGPSWADHLATGRFEDMSPGATFAPLPQSVLNWEMVYWVADDWSHVMFMRSYLESLGEPYQLLWDMDYSGGKYAILTNYVNASWRKHDSA